MRERPSASSVVAAVLARSALSLLLERPDLYNDGRSPANAAGQTYQTARRCSAGACRISVSPAGAERTVGQGTAAFGG
jgi:hypothetical protein